MYNINLKNINQPNNEYLMSIQKTLEKNSNNLYFEFRKSQRFYNSDKNIG